MMSEINFHRIHHRITLERARLEARLERLEQRRVALFGQGVRETSVRIQKALARRVRDLDVQAAGMGRTLKALQLQGAVLAHLAYARENDDLLNQGLLAQVDWNAMLASVNEWRATQEAMLERLQGVLGILNPPSGRGAAARPAEPCPSERGTAVPPSDRPAPAAVLATLASVDVEGVEWGIAASVPDGDGLRLEDGRRVRYIGIDAPEVAHQGRPAEPFAEEAKVFNERLVVGGGKGKDNGKRVHLERDTSDTDRNGRLLRYVYAGDAFVNAELVRAGLARAFVLWPDEGRAEEFARLEKEARRQRRGMWGADGER